MEYFMQAFRSATAWDVGLFVHLATLGYVLGFLFKDQLILRALVLIATVSYIIYYYAFPAEPLWGAIFGSFLIMIANIIGTIRLVHDRFPINIPPEHMKIFNQLPGVAPGEFRRLMKVGESRGTSSLTMLTQEGEQPDYLYYLTEGVANANKGDTSFGIPSGRFIGEVSFILGGNASATVVLPVGSMYFRWEREKLNTLLLKNPNLQRSFEALIGRDLAAKVASSQPVYVKEAIAVE